MPTTLNVLDCSVTKNSITVTFSEPVDNSASLVSNYTVYDPPGFPAPTGLADLGWTTPSPTVNQTVVVLTAPAGKQPFTAGDYVLVGISGITAASGNTLSPTDVSAQVPYEGGAGRVVRDVEDAISYPILTEEISNRPYPLSTFPGGGTGGGGGSSSLGQLASRTVTDVLGWKVNPTDPKGFIGALTQAFTLTDVEGHVESSWNPQMPAIQTDLGGSITGAQASLYMRAKEAVDQSSSLLDTLYPLDPEADPEYVKALRDMVRSQMTQIVRELAVIGLPSVLRIDTYFGILLDQNPGSIGGPGDINFNPDEVGGTLGKLRDTYGIQFAGNRFNNSVADEVVITNFRVISDYLTSLMQSWISNRNFFFVRSNQPAFFGTQLVLISRQFNVIAETVNELRFALDSVFIGPAERQALLLEFADPALPPRFLEGMLIEIEAFVGQEAPQLLKDGGKITVTNNILPVARALLNMVEEAHNPTNNNELPDGFRTARVRNALDDLQDQLETLVERVEQVEQVLPTSEDKLSIASIAVGGPDDNGTYLVSLFGEGIEPGVTAEINSITAVVLPQSKVTFYSAQRVDIEIDQGQLNLAKGPHDITLTNPDGDSVTLEDAIIVSQGGTTLHIGTAVRPGVSANPAFRPGVPRTKGRGAGQKPHWRKPNRKVSINIGGRQGLISAGPQQKAAGPTITPHAAAPTAPQSPQSAAVPNPVQNLGAAQSELGKRVDQQSQEIMRLDKKIESALDEIKKAILDQGKALDAKLEQHSKQQQEQLEEKIRQFTQKPGK